MSKLREAAQQALEALENDAMQRTYAGGVRITNAAIALRAALAEPDINAELVEALKGMIDLYDTDDGCKTLPQCVVARAALAKVEVGE